MSENLLDQIRVAINYWFDADVDDAMRRDALPGAIGAVVGPELDRLHAEVERLEGRLEKAWRQRDAEAEDGLVAMNRFHHRAITAEAERDVLRARLAKAEALERDWSEALDGGCPSCGPLGGTFPDCDHAEGYHHALSDLRAVLASVPEPSDSEPEPCRCHNTHAAITPRHEGHCCFYPADRKCHPTEVEAWAASHRAISEPAPDADRVAGERCPDSCPGVTEDGAS